jgi:hypothetical protein
MTSPGDSKQQLLRHSLATLAYRGGKAVRDAPASFAAFRASPTTRTPAEVLAHIGDLLDWALCLAQGRQEWHDAPPLAWDQEVARFFTALERLDAYLASEAPLGFSAEQILQAPIADALTHVGQLTMLRRMGGAPIRGENYLKADIQAGRVGAAQSAPRKEFD